MKKPYLFFGAASAALILFRIHSITPLASPPPAREVSPLQLEEEIPVPSIAGRIDHFTADGKRRLIFSALGNNTVEVVNVFDGKVVHSMTGLNEPQGPLYVPGLDKIFVANAGDGSVKIFDGKTYEFLKSIALGEDADNIRWDEVSKRVLVGYGGDGTGAIAMIDPATEARVGKDLKTGGGHPESFQIEKKGPRVFVNVPDDGNVVEVIDRKTGDRKRWELGGPKANFAMTLDEDNHRLFTITRKPPLMIALDTETGREVAKLAVAGESDDVYLDTERRRIYIIGAQGFISVVQQDDPDHYELIENVPSAVGVRTGYFFANHDRMYVGIPAKGSEPAQIWTYEAED